MIRGSDEARVIVNSKIMLEPEYGGAIVATFCTVGFCFGLGIVGERERERVQRSKRWCLEERESGGGGGGGGGR